MVDGNRVMDIARSKLCYETCKGLENCEFGGWISFLPEIAFNGKTPEILWSRCQAFFDEEERKKKLEQAGQKQRRLEEAIRSSKLPKRLMECTFESFSTDRVPKLAAFAKKSALKAFEENSSIVFAGPSGVGKSHLAAAILNRSLACGKTGLFLPFVSLLTDLKNSFETDTTGRIIEALRATDCLILDDVGQEMTTNYSSERLFEIVDYRYSSYKQLVITTNCFNWEALGSKIGERGTYIVRRLKSMGGLIFLDVPEHRGGETVGGKSYRSLA